MRFWSVPPEEVPVGEQDRITWLYDWWALIDGWIEQHQPEDAGRVRGVGATARHP
jgi:hypothetical protein